MCEESEVDGVKEEERKRKRREKGQKTYTLKDNFRILQPRPYFLVLLCQSDGCRSQFLKLVQY